MSILEVEDILHTVLKPLSLPDVIIFGQASRYFKRLSLEYLSLRVDHVLAMHIADNILCFCRILDEMNSWIHSSIAQNIVKAGDLIFVSNLNITCPHNTTIEWLTFSPNSVIPENLSRFGKVSQASSTDASHSALVHSLSFYVKRLDPSQQLFQFIFLGDALVIPSSSLRTRS